MAIFGVRPISVGTLYGDKSCLTYLRNYGEPLAMPSIMWLIEGDGPTVVVDTGAPDAAWANAHHQPMTRSPDEEPGRALALAHLDPESVETVVISHLHWDHASNTHLFSNARVLVQLDELEYARNPLPIHYRGYEHPSIGLFPHYIERTRFTCVDGDMQLQPGISLLATPGHTPGSMSVVVDTEVGTVVVASDTVPLFENWESAEPGMRHWPTAEAVSLSDLYASYERIDRLSPALVLPGHDSRVLERDVWGVA